MLIGAFQVDRIENTRIVGKGENIGFHHCLLFPKCLQNASPLSLYHIIPTFNDSEEGGFLKTFLEKERMLVTMIAFTVLSASAFNLDWSKILWFVTELRDCQPFTP